MKDIFKITMSYTTIVFAIFTLSVATPISSDPCETYKLLPRPEYRGGKCEYDSNKPVCDRGLSHGWYRVNSTSRNLEIQTQPANLRTCGTKFPYWMKGEHPIGNNDEVSRTVCQTAVGTNCSKEFGIKVKHCDDFYVYELNPLPSCDEGYCFGVNDECPPLDPCDIYEYKEVNFDNDHSKICGPHCDTFGASQWYSLTGFSDIQAHLNQSYTNCSSNRLVWIKDSTQNEENGIQNYTLCVQTNNNTCSEVVYAYSKQCSGYTVYNLPDVLSTTCERVCRNTAEQTWFVCRTLPPLDDIGENLSIKIQMNGLLMIGSLAVLLF